MVRQLARGDPPGGADVRALPAVAAQRRGPAARARHRHLPRDGAQLVDPFRADVRRKRVQAMRQHTHWRWHLDEVYVNINGEMRSLWRAGDHEGEVLESYVTKTRDRRGRSSSSRRR